MKSNIFYQTHTIRTCETVIGEKRKPDKGANKVTDKYCRRIAAFPTNTYSLLHLSQRQCVCVFGVTAKSTLGNSLLLVK